MSDASSQASARRWRAIAQERLLKNRWTLVGAAVLIAGLCWAGSLPFWTAAASIAALILLSAILPTRTMMQARVDKAAGARRSEPLTALDLAAAVSDPMIIFGKDGQVVAANEATTANFGQISPGLSLQLKFRAPEMRELIETTLATGQAATPVDYSERVPLERTYRVSAVPIGSSSNLFVLIFKDQSEARRIDRMRADFIANASHELRTPLASITGFIETLRGPAKNDPTARETFLQIMHDQTGRMARLIDDLLSLSRLEMKPLLSMGTRVELRETLGAVIDSLSPMALEMGVRIETVFPDGEISVSGSRDELIQVFQNLLENACKYGQSGGKVQISLGMTYDSLEPEAVVSFRDFGPGIAEEHIPRITERFYRVDVETSRARKGTGLGLSIVKHILTRHNGRLSVRSELGNGAEFTVHMPQAEAIDLAA